MKTEIEIRDRLYQEIKSVCDANSMDVDDYLSKLIEDGYYLDKYGDLNDVVIKKDVKSNEEEPTEAPSESIKEDNRATAQEEAKNVAEAKEEPKEKDIQTTKKTKRTLKSR